MLNLSFSEFDPQATCAALDRCTAKWAWAPGQTAQFTSENVAWRTGLSAWRAHETARIHHAHRWRGHVAARRLGPAEQISWL